MPNILARSRAPSAVAAVAVPRFAKWFVDVDPLFVGGWKLTKINCGAVAAPQASCSLTYGLGGAKDAPRGVTNATFLAALPDAFSAPAFSKEDKEVTVQAMVPFGPDAPLGKLLQTLPTSMALRTDFGSTLQLLRPAASKAVLQDIGLFGSIPERASLQSRMSTRAPGGKWRAAAQRGGDWHFPPYVSVNEIVLTINLDADSDIQKSKFELNVKGDAYARDGGKQ
jgi:hypothetical protein